MSVLTDLVTAAVIALAVAVYYLLPAPIMALVTHDLIRRLHYVWRHSENN